MIVIEPYDPLPERPRYPGQYQLPVLVPPSPEGTYRPPPPERKRSFWFFALIGGIFAAVALSGSESAGGLGQFFVTPQQRKRGTKLIYLWKYFGRSGNPTIVRKKQQAYFKKRSGVEGELYPVFAYSADHARNMVAAGEVKPYRAGAKAAPKAQADPQLLTVGIMDYLRDVWKTKERPDIQSACLHIFGDQCNDPGDNSYDRIRNLIQMWGYRDMSALNYDHIYHLDALIDRQKKARQKMLKRQESSRPAPTPKIPRSEKGKGEKGIKSRMDQVILEMEEYLAKIEREKAELLRMSKESPPPEPPEPEQMRLFGEGFTMDDYLSGRIANCAIWIPDGYGGWNCGAYGRVCDSPSCAKPTQKDSRQSRVCVKTQKVFSKFLKKKVERCKRYEATCTGPACMDFTMPFPQEKSERTKARKDEVKSYAEWMADRYNEEHFEKIPYLAREILSRGGIAPLKYPTETWLETAEKGRRADEEYVAIPLFLRNKKGLPCDEMANEMGYKYCDELREDILRAYPKKAKGAWKKISRKTWRDFEDDARWEIEEKLYAGEWDGLAGSPARVWRTTYRDFIELQRTKDDPALSKELNWVLQRTKTDPEGMQRVFQGDLPGHMKRRIRDWLFDRYQHPERLKIKGMKVDMRSGRKVTDYILNHPYYTVIVRFWSGGSVLIMENRANYHAESIREAIAEGKDVPKKVLREYAPYMPEAKAALGSGFGQELFPELKRELRFDPPEDIATSDDPVIACMQRLGWKLPRIEELKASIAEKMTPDLFTMKIKPLSPGEKEYQRVVGECLEQAAGTA